jgi:Ca2+-binding EF-hand superfamily protein
MWDEHDRDGNGYLDRAEAKTFLDELSKVISDDRAKFYNPDYFESYFEEFDDDNNGFLSKSELSLFIKKTFRNPNKPHNDESLFGERGRKKRE